MSGGGNWGFNSSQTTKQKFGRYGMKRNQFAGLPVSTGYSTAYQGNVTLDPSIRSIQDRSLGRIDELYGKAGSYGDELISNTRSLRNRFLGNQSAYSESQLNPLRQQVATRRGEIQRSLGLRGVSGSSFGDQTINAFDIESQRGLQDASANVEMQQLQALTGIDANLANQMFGKISIQSALNGESLQIAKERLAQELSALGLGQAQITLMANQFENYQRRMLQNLNDVSHTDNISYSSGMGGGSGGGIE